MNEQKFKEFLRILDKEFLEDLFIYYTIYQVVLDCKSSIRTLITIEHDTIPKIGRESKYINWLKEVKQERGI